MNITDESMMGFNFSRKKDNFRIKGSSWNKYIEALEACLEAEEELSLLKDREKLEIMGVLQAGRDYAFSQFRL